MLTRKSRQMEGLVTCNPPASANETRTARDDAADACVVVWGLGFAVSSRG